MHIPRDVIQSGANWYLYSTGIFLANYIPPANGQGFSAGIMPESACRAYCDVNPCYQYMSVLNRGAKTPFCNIFTGGYGKISSQGGFGALTIGTKISGTGLFGFPAVNSLNWSSDYNNYAVGGLNALYYYSCQSIGTHVTYTYTEVAIGSNCGIPLAVGHYRSLDGYQNCDIRNAAGYAFSCDPISRLAIDCVYGSGFSKGICTPCSATAPYAFGQLACSPLTSRLIQPPKRLHL